MVQLEVKDNTSGEVIKVVGVGGGGGNAVDRMIQSGIVGVEYVAMNTDLQALHKSRAEQKVQLGVKLTRGLGAGANPEIGRLAAEENIEDIKNALDGADMVFIAAGMGGGTGTGAAPVVARAAREMDILTVAIVTKPFTISEGKPKMRKAEAGIAELKEHVDTLIVLPNDKILEAIPEGALAYDSFALANQVLERGVRGITDIIKVPGMINVDFADVKNTMLNRGVAHMGIGSASGENRAMEAAKQAVFSPLLETTVKGANAVLVNIVGSRNSLQMMEVQDAASFIMKSTGREEDADSIIGTTFVDEDTDLLEITLIATGFDEELEQRRREEYIPAGRKSVPSKSQKEEQEAEETIEDLFQNSDLQEPPKFVIPEWLSNKKR
ncbi:cell division protein FtsZ [Filifactor villosus]|uniref:Cell division protein FtsZ n=1 Tax=Filifactor villosus TaxID=29374 RepID=A0ABV9QN42_9FIRM